MHIYFNYIQTHKICKKIFIGDFVSSFACLLFSFRCVFVVSRNMSLFLVIIIITFIILWFSEIYIKKEKERERERETRE